MAKDPWTDSDPQPGDFDEFLASIEPGDSRYVDARKGIPEAKLTRVVRVSGEDAARLDALAAERGLAPGEIVAELVRNA